MLPSHDIVISVMQEDDIMCGCVLLTNVFLPPIQSGGECMILPSVSADDAPKLFPQFRVVSVPSGKQYIRVTPQPK